MTTKTHTPDEIAAMIERAITHFDGVPERGGEKSSTRLLLNDIAAMLREVAAERDAWRDKYNALGDQAIREVANLATECGRMDVQRDAAAAELASVSRERDRLATMVEKLRGYAVHDAGCEAGEDNPFPAERYTCGLSDVLKESENGRP